MDSVYNRKNRISILIVSVFTIAFLMLQIFSFYMYADDFGFQASDYWDAYADFDVMTVDTPEGKHYIIGNPFRIFTNGETANSSLSDTVTIERYYSSDGGTGLLEYEQWISNDLLLLDFDVHNGTYVFTFHADTALIDSKKIDEFVNSVALRLDFRSQQFFNCQVTISSSAIGYSSQAEVDAEMYSPRAVTSNPPPYYTKNYQNMNSNITASKSWYFDYEHNDYLEIKLSPNNAEYITKLNNVKPRLYFLDDMGYRTGEYAVFQPDTVDSYLRLGNYTITLTVVISAPANNSFPLQLTTVLKQPLSDMQFIRLSDSWYGFTVGSTNIQYITTSLSAIEPMYRAVSGFFDIEIFPGFNLGIIGVCCLSMLIITIVLKVFVGG